jgi:SAM-dependent methyltransferase
MKEWFEDWFDTVYYNALYKERDEEEADRFVEQLVKELQLETDSKILDVGCGTGRHAIALNELGFDVTGVDLSFKKIQADLPFENERLHFYRHDMRHIFRINYFDCVFNFFTSFGYFELPNDEKNAAAGMATNLKLGGYLVIDYMNAEYVKQRLVQDEKLHAGGYDFIIDKCLDNHRISKKITVLDKDRSLVFYEKVRMYSLLQMINLFSNFSLANVKTYGSYRLEPYDELNSERMILVFRKIAK